MKNRREKLEAIFEAAAALETDAQRRDYLDRACPDAGLRSEVEALLKAMENPDSLFENGDTISESTLSETPVLEQPGSMIGRYKLLQKVGEGGMGVVYMAEQTEPVTRKVALKIIKLGMDTKQVVARFEAERQALAMMDHPNIAKVLDAGATDTGSPYFVMELVRGVPITEYCDKNKLSTGERLRLFMPVCQAIQHAHQKGVIHRDIKPSNVMVTLHDGNPVPKVIDFGIAKATNQKLTEKTLFTNYSQMIGTPAYMSPEQAEMSGLDVDTRTDVYSLGVLLYELLTGTTPFPSKDLMSMGYGEMQRIIAEKEPPKPSTRLSTMDNQNRTVMAANRSMDVSALGKVFVGDLDWIVMKALEKDRSHRYETANGLVADLQRHLDDEPVSAAAPTFGYQLRKFARRNKKYMRVAAVVAGLLVVVTTMATIQAVRASRAERMARDAHKQAEIARSSEIQQREEAEQQSNRATTAETAALEKAEENRLNLYAADMNSANHALEKNNIDLARNLLSRHIPTAPNESDLRGFEWRYLWQQAQQQYEFMIPEAHEGRVESVQYSPDGKWLLSAGQDHKIKVWDAQSLELVSTIVYSEEPTFQNRTFFKAKFSFDGKFIAAKASRGSAVKIYNWLNSGSPFLTLEGSDSFEFSPASNDLLVSYPDRVELLDLESNEAKVVDSTDGKTGRFIGDQIFTTTRSKLSYVIYEPNTSTPLKRFRLESGNSFHSLTDTAFDPDGKSVAMSMLKNFQIFSWDTRESLVSIPMDGMVAGLNFSPDGKWLAVAGTDRTVRIYNTQTYQEEKILLGHAEEVWSVAWAPDGKTLASGGRDRSITFWKPEAGEQSDLHQGQVLQVDPQSNFTVFWAEDKYSLMHLETQQVLWTQTDEWVAGFTPEGSELLTVQGSNLNSRDVLTGSLKRATPLSEADELGEYRRFKVSPNGKILCGRSGDGQLRLWNMESMKVVARSRANVLADRFLNRRGFVVSPDSRLIIFPGGSKEHVLWNLETMKEYTFSENSSIAGVAFSPASKYFATATLNSVVHIRKTEDLTRRYSLRGHIQGVICVAFSPDGLTVASGGSGRTIRFWHLETGRETATIRQDVNQIWSLNFTPDGKRLLVEGGLGEGRRGFKIITVPTLGQIDAELQASNVSFSK